MGNHWQKFRRNQFALWQSFILYKVRLCAITHFLKTFVAIDKSVYDIPVDIVGHFSFHTVDWVSLHHGNIQFHRNLFWGFALWRGEVGSGSERTGGTASIEVSRVLSRSGSQFALLPISLRSWLLAIERMADRACSTFGWALWPPFARTSANAF